MHICARLDMAAVNHWHSGRLKRMHGGDRKVHNACIEVRVRWWDAVWGLNNQKGFPYTQNTDVYIEILLWSSDIRTRSLLF